MTDVKRILEKLRSSGNPIITKDRARIYWSGEKPPVLRGDHTSWEDRDSIQLNRVAERLWVHEAVLPADSYIEYAFFRGEKRIRDPFNPRRTPNGLGNTNHYFNMPEYQPSPWHLEVDQTPKGTIFEHRLPTDEFLAGIERTVYFYQPPVDQPAPLVVVYDGREYLERARLPTMIDNLIAAGKIRPLALAMISNSKRYRVMEYACADTTIWHLLQVLLPFARQKLCLVDIKEHPGAYGILGASFGGLMALYTLLRTPNIFGHGLCQAGGYEVEGFKFPVWDILSNIRGTDARIWMDCGRFDWLISANRRMAAALGQMGAKFRFHEYNAGHNFPAWRDCLPLGLEFLYPANTASDEKN